MIGYNWDTFCGIKNTHNEGGMAVLMVHNRRVPYRKNRVEEAVEQALKALALENPSLGQK